MNGAQTLELGETTLTGGVQPATPPSADQPTLAAYAERWLAGLSGLRPRTLEGYRHSLNRHLLPRLGDRPLAEIQVDDVIQVITELNELGYAAWTVRTIMTPLSRVFSHAIRKGVIRESPMSRLDRSERPSVWAKEQRVLNSDEIAALLDAAPRRYRTLLATAVFTGLRQNELLALRWEHVDFREQLIHVRTALDRHGRHVQPKTRNAIRDVVLIPALARLLLAHRSSSPFAGRTDYVFASRAGTALHWRNASRRVLGVALQDADLGHLRWQDLRHTFASMCIANGASIMFLTRQLGHSRPDVTLRVYGHLFDNALHAQRTRDLLELQFAALL